MCPHTVPLRQRHMYVCEYKYKLVLEHHCMLINHTAQIRVRKMGVYLGKYCYIMIIMLVLVLGKEVRSQLLKNGYYSTSCPKAESIVRSTVESHFDSDPTISPGLLRLHFHDCFVQVSILIFLLLISISFLSIMQVN